MSGDPDGRAGAPKMGTDDAETAGGAGVPRKTGFGRERTSADETMGFAVTAMIGARTAVVVVVAVVTGAAAAAAADAVAITVVVVGAAAAAAAVVAAAVVAGGAAAAASFPALKRRTGRS